jgi:hypothetical protein
LPRTRPWPHARFGRGGDPDDRDHLLRCQTSHRRPPLQRIARRDPHLRAARFLAVDDVSRDVFRQLLDEEGLADHDLVDRLLEELGETGHVHALLARVEVDEAVDFRRDELLRAAPAEADRLGHALDARPRQAQPHLGDRGLKIV